MADLTKGERRYLSRRACAWCDMPLDMDGCGAIYEKCSEETQRTRREICLRGYKPRAIAAQQKESANGD